MALQDRFSCFSSKVKTISQRPYGPPQPLQDACPTAGTDLLVAPPISNKNTSIFHEKTFKSAPKRLIWTFFHENFKTLQKLKILNLKKYLAHDSLDGAVDLFFGCESADSKTCFDEKT